MSVKIEGLDKLAAACRELPLRVGRSALRKATSDGMAVIRNEARTLAPVYTGPVAQGHPPPGTLKRNIQMKRNNSASGPMKQVFNTFVLSGKQYQQSGKGGKVNRDAYYWRFVEFGTVKMSARPFLRPAFDMKKGEAVAALSNTLAARILQEAQALKR